MEPKLIDEKVLKKLLKKNYLQFNRKWTSLNKIPSVIKENWYILLIIIFIIVIFINLYYHNKNKKKEKFINIPEPEEIEPEPFFGGHEAEYYKMLPRVTSAPDIRPYQY
jgi:hypothetical protein